MPLAFLTAWVVSVLDKSPRAVNEMNAYDDQLVRAQTGFGAAGASSH